MLTRIPYQLGVVARSKRRTLAHNLPNGVVALFDTESLYYGGIALASWLAGHSTEARPGTTHGWALGLAAMLVVLVSWVVLPLGTSSPQ